MTDTDRFATVIRLPVTRPATDPVFEDEVDRIRFHAGFDDANRQLCRLPPTWAKHFADVTMAADPGLSGDDPSYTRGYRAALYGYLRHSD